MTKPPAFTPRSVFFSTDTGDETALVLALARRSLVVGTEDVSFADAARLRDHWRELALTTGVACFQAVSDRLPTVHAACAILRRAVTLEDGFPVYIRAAFLFAGPSSKRSFLVKLCSLAERLATDTTLRSQLTDTDDEGAALALLLRHFSSATPDLRAADVMRAPYMYLTPEKPLGEVVREMLRFNVEAVGIVDKDGKLIGEITSDILFRMGMPEFFSQLKSVSFLGDFDPFEKYFEKESHLTAGDIMTREFAAVKEDTPILEVIFHLAVQSHWKVYVVRDGKMIGVIDRMRVLQQVLAP